MTEENDAYCWFISVTKHSNTDWNSIVDSESMMYTANNYLMVNYSTFIIIMIIIKTPGMFFVQCFTATSVTDLRWRSLIALALNCLLGGIANHSSRICALILLLRIDLPKFHHRVVHLAHDFMCKELRHMISSSLYIYWLILIGKPSVLRLLFLCFMKIHLGISSVYFCSLYLFFWRSNALSHVFRLMARRDKLHMCR